MGIANAQLDAAELQIRQNLFSPPSLERRGWGWLINYLQISILSEEINPSYPPLSKGRD